LAQRPWSTTGSGVLISVRLTPRSARDALEGAQTLSDGRAVLAVRVRAVPEDGRANESLLRLLARALDVAASDCALATGGKSRLKSVAVTGDPERLDRALEAICGGA
jgi:uncharacterized protein